MIVGFCKVNKEFGHIFHALCDAAVGSSEEELLLSELVEELDSEPLSTYYVMESLTQQVAKARGFS